MPAKEAEMSASSEGFVVEKPVDETAPVAAKPVAEPPRPELRRVDSVAGTPREENPEKKTFFLSWIIFGFMTNLIWSGFKRTLDESDLWELTEEDKAETNYKVFKGHFDVEVKRWRDAGGETDEKVPLPRIGMSLIKTLWKGYIGSLFWQMLGSGCQLALPIMLQNMVTYLRVGAVDGGQTGYLYALGFFVLQFSRGIGQSQSLIMSQRTGVRARSVMIVAVYQKALRISSSADLDTGKTVSLLSNDAQRFFEVFQFLNEAVMGFPQLIAVIALLYQVIYAYTFIGFALLLLVLPVNAITVRGMQANRGEMVGKTDRRTRLLGEVLQAIKVVKFYAWERSFQSRIEESRKEELSSLRGYLVRFGFMMTLIGATPNLMTTIAILSVAAGNVLFPEIVFSTISYFQLVRTPITLTPFVVSAIAQSNISLERMRGFLMMEELPGEDGEAGFASTPSSSPTLRSVAADSAAAATAADSDTAATGLTVAPSGVNLQMLHKSDALISINQGSFRWPAEKVKDHSLTNVTLNVSRGQLVMVVGAVGSGKSTFVNAVLGEIPQSGGERNLKGSVAFVPQQAWIVNSTLRNNIVFGYGMNQDRYDRVLDKCCLRPDLEILRAGDQTAIGERGVNLSGGQKQRIAIARAVYSKTDVVLLDDPLSAVDAHVGRSLFHDCIRTELRDRAVVMVTNQLQYLPYADFILVLKEGSVVESGTYQQLMDQGLEFASLVRTFVSEEKDEEKEDEHIVVTAETLLAPKIEGTTKAADELVSEEDRQGGLVELSVWATYFKGPGSYFLFSIVVVGYLLEMGCFGGSQYWLSWYTSALNQTTVPIFLGTYAGLMLGMAFFNLVRNQVFMQFALKTNEQLHSKLLAAVMRYPQSFFDTNPLGRIINRFTKDVDTMDLLLPSSMALFLMSTFYTLESVVMIAIVVPIVLVPFVFIAIVLYLLSRFYRKCAVDLQRLEAVSRSPLLSHFSESLAGRASIRAYKQKDRFIDVNFERTNANTRALVQLQQARQWLAVRVDTVAAITLLIVGILITNGRVAGNGVFATTAASSALALTNSLQLTVFFNFVTNQQSEVETKLNSVERLDEYSLKPQEAPAVIADNRPAASWPSEGKVHFENVFMRYRPDLPNVIEDLSFTLHGGEKIGVVGRTGAGKSSVMQTLFRIVDFTEGKIEVDGVNISKIGLEDLRRKLAIIPQEPYLFSGTIRNNLDPFEEYTDDQVWEVLRHIQLYPVVSAFELKLNHPVTEGGENFSVGQRQLVCLGRALLRRPRILLMDEATASVDVQTDALIQKTVREQFADATVITIAHRLNTIIDYDRVMVLNKGRLAELDAPGHLLQNPTSLFTLLVEDTGKESAAMLRSMAMAKLTEKEGAGAAPAAV